MLHEQRNAQLVADAYYILSDSTQRAQYDSLRSARDARERSTDPGSSANFFANFANMFAGTGTGSSTGAGAGAGVPPPQRPDAEGVFGDVFEDVRVPFRSSAELSADCLHSSMEWVYMYNP